MEMADGTSGAGGASAAAASGGGGGAKRARKGRDDLSLTDEGVAVAAAGKALAVQPSEVWQAYAAANASATSLQSTAALRYKESGLIQILKWSPLSEPATTPEFWCNGCLKRYALSVKGGSGAPTVQYTTLLKHLRSTHSEYVLPVDDPSKPTNPFAAVAAANTQRVEEADEVMIGSAASASVATTRSKSC